MKRLFLLAICTATAGNAIMAQNVVDAVRFGSTDMAGTARYRSMGGAFGSLGGDPTAMTDNPAGLGIYRSSEFSLTPHLAATRTETDASAVNKELKRDLSMGNLAYILSFKPENAKSLVNFNVGVGFNHSEGTKRRYATTLDYDPGQPVSALSSFGDYLAVTANNALLNQGMFANPDDALNVRDLGRSTMPLTSLMGYQSNAIVPDQRSGQTEGVIARDRYQAWPFYQRMFIREENRTDEYNLSLAGNWDDVIYAGLTLTAVDFNSTIISEFNEDYSYDYNGDYTQYFNNLETRGSGVNIKFGLIAKPIDWWRIGVAVHTPMWFNMKDIYSGTMYTTASDKIQRDGIATGEYEYKYRYYSPWEYQLSTAFVLGTHGLLSLEYDMKDFTSMKYKEDREAGWSEPALENTNRLMDDFTRPQHILKAGAEWRITPRLSLRAGYQLRTSPFDDKAFDTRLGNSWVDDRGGWGNDNELVYSSSTKPNYSLLDDQHFITGGLGWRGKSWYVDLACVHRTVNEQVAAFPTTDALWGWDNGIAVMTTEDEFFAVQANHIKMTTRTLSWDLTLGFKF